MKGSNGGGLATAPLSTGACAGAGVGVKKFPGGRVGAGACDCVGPLDGGSVGDAGPDPDGVGDGAVAGGGAGGPWDTSDGVGPGGLPAGGAEGPDAGTGGFGGTPVEGPCTWRRLRRNPPDKTPSPICCCCEFRASAMPLVKKQKQARATARTTHEHRPAEVAIVGGGSVSAFLRSTIFKSPKYVRRQCASARSPNSDLRVDSRGSSNLSPRKSEGV